MTTSFSTALSKVLAFGLVAAVHEQNEPDAGFRAAVELLLVLEQGEGDVSVADFLRTAQTSLLAEAVRLGYEGGEPKARQYLNGLITEIEQEMKRAAQPVPEHPAAKLFKRQPADRGRTSDRPAAPPSSKPASVQKPASDRPRLREMDELVAEFRKFFTQRVEQNLGKNLSLEDAIKRARHSVKDKIRTSREFANQMEMSICSSYADGFTYEASSAPKAEPVAEASAASPDNSDKSDDAPETVHSTDSVVAEPAAEDTSATLPSPVPESDAEEIDVEMIPVVTLDEAVNAYVDGCDILMVSRDLIGKILSSEQEDAAGLCALIKGKVVEHYETNKGNGKKTPMANANAWLKRTIAHLGGDYLQLVVNE